MDGGSDSHVVDKLADLEGTIRRDAGEKGVNLVHAKKKLNFKREGKKKRKKKKWERLEGSGSRVDRDYLCYHVIAIGQESVGKRNTRDKVRQGQGRTRGIDKETWGQEEEAGKGAVYCTRVEGYLC